MPLDAIQAILDHAETLMAGHTRPRSMIGTFLDTGVFIEISCKEQSFTHPSQAPIDIQARMSALGAFVQSRPDIIKALSPLVSDGFRVLVRDGLVLIWESLYSLPMNYLFQPLGARNIPTSTTTDIPSVQKVLGELAVAMRPGTSMRVWDRDISMHTRMQLLAQAPGIEALAHELYLRPTSTAIFPLHLFRFDNVAVLTDSIEDLAWMAIPGS